MAFEKLPAKIAATIAKQGWPLVGKIDVSAGAGVLDAENTRCCWDMDGKRITVSFSPDGGLMVSVSREVDPVYAERKGIK